MKNLATCIAPNDELMSERFGMLPAVMLSAAITASPQTALPLAVTQQCFATMDGAAYNGDPSDRRLMKRNVAICARSVAELNAMRPRTVDQGPEKLFLLGRALDRAATLSYMGLGDAAAALHDVKLANLYFRVAARLTTANAAYHAAALANVQLTSMQLHTLNSDPALVARRPAHSRQTAYHRL